MLASEYGCPSGSPWVPEGIFRRFPACVALWRHPADSADAGALPKVFIGPVGVVNTGAAMDAEIAAAPIVERWHIRHARRLDPEIRCHGWRSDERGEREACNHELLHDDAPIFALETYHASSVDGNSTPMPCIFSKGETDFASPCDAHCHRATRVEAAAANRRCSATAGAAGR